MDDQNQVNNQLQKKPEIRVKVPDEILSGKYSNTMQVSHTRGEFILDFMNIVPPQGIMTSRIIVSPSHMKRIVRAMQENLEKFEQKYGQIQETQAPPPITIN